MQKFRKVIIFLFAVLLSIAGFIGYYQVKGYLFEKNNVNEAKKHIPLVITTFDLTRNELELLRNGEFSRLHLYFEDGEINGIKDERVPFSTGVDLHSDIVKELLPQKEIDALEFLYESSDLPLNYDQIYGSSLSNPPSIRVVVFSKNNVILNILSGNPSSQSYYSYTEKLDDEYYIGIENRRGV